MKKIFNNKKVLTTILIIAIILLIIITGIIIKIASGRKVQTTIINEESVETGATGNEMVVELNENEVPDINELANETNDKINEITNEVTDEKSKNTTKQNNANGATYKIKINCQQNVVNIYEKDSNGEYTKCVKAMLCSIGKATPRSGTYTLTNYGRWKWLGLFGNVYGQYATQIKGNILFHSVPYTEKYNKGSLEYWEYDKLGTNASLGCIRLTVKNAKWIYDNCKAGTKVTFYSDSNPGPLGKPTESKISGNEQCRNWDPTDPDSANPWNKKQEESPKPSQEPKEPNVIENNTVQNTIIENNVTNTIQNDIYETDNKTIENTEKVNETENTTSTV